MNNRSGLAATIFCYLIWGSQSLYWNTLSEFNSMFILCVRIVMSVVSLYAYLLATGRFKELIDTLKDKAKMRYLLPASAMIGIDWALFIWAVGNGHVLDITVGYYLNPLVIFLVGVLVFREKSHFLEYVAVIIAFIGVLISTVQFGAFPIISVAAAVFWPSYATIKKSAHADPIISIAVETTVLAPLAIVAVLLFFRGDGGLATITTSNIPLLLVAGIVTSLPMILYTFAENHIPFKTVGILQYLGTTISFVCGTAFFHEEVTPSKLVMFVFIWSGIILYTITTLRKERIPAN